MTDVPLRQVLMHALTCDVCGKQPDDDYFAWADADMAIDSAREADWQIGPGHYLCPAHRRCEVCYLWAARSEVAPFTNVEGDRPVALCEKHYDFLGEDDYLARRLAVVRDLRNIDEGDDHAADDSHRDQDRPDSAAGGGGAVRDVQQLMVGDGGEPRIVVELESAAVGPETSDGTHTFAELYAQRALYHALFLNDRARRDRYAVHKSWQHHDGALCFGGGWFIVVLTGPTGQITQHYPADQWDLFHCETRERAEVWDGHDAEQGNARLAALIDYEAAEAAG